MIYLWRSLLLLQVVILYHWHSFPLYEKKSSCYTATIGFVVSITFTLIILISKKKLRTFFTFLNCHAFSYILQCFISRELMTDNVSKQLFSGIWTLSDLNTGFIQQLCKLDRIGVHVLTNSEFCLVVVYQM